MIWKIAKIDLTCRTFNAMYNQNKILRVLQLISLLKSKPPKSIRHLSEIIESTERTIYRYLDLLAEVGFQIEKDNFNRFYIFDDGKSRDFNFSQEEIKLLNQLVQTVGKDSLLKDSILKKLYVASNVQINAQHLVKAHLGKIIETLADAIQSRNQVILKKYYSVNSNNISDRLVEPICFTDNYQSLVAYEVKTGMNKYFNIERITSIEQTMQSFQFTENHKFDVPDVFGFSQTKEKHSIELNMSMRVYVLLKEEYPMTSPLIKYDAKNKLYNFKADIYSLKPIIRFILGFLDEITIVKSNELKESLRKHVDSLLKVKKEKKF
jgi:predicted DNA-binding transcriptional regulator YafY